MVCCVEQLHDCLDEQEQKNREEYEKRFPPVVPGVDDSGDGEDDNDSGEGKDEKSKVEKSRRQMQGENAK